MFTQSESDTKFSTSGFFHDLVPPSPLGPFLVLMKSCGDICNLVFIAGVVDVNNTGDKKFIAVNNDTGVKQLQ
jgi:hypothetical protein